MFFGEQQIQIGAQLIPTLEEVISISLTWDFGAVRNPCLLHKTYRTPALVAALGYNEGNINSHVSEKEKGE